MAEVVEYAISVRGVLSGGGNCPNLLPPWLCSQREWVKGGSSVQILPLLFRSPIPGLRMAFLTEVAAEWARISFHQDSPPLLVNICQLASINTSVNARARRTGEGSRQVM